MVDGNDDNCYVNGDKEVLNFVFYSVRIVPGCSGMW